MPDFPVPGHIIIIYIDLDAIDREWHINFRGWTLSTKCTYIHPLLDVLVQFCVCACRLLKEKDKSGTYLIRGGSHVGAAKVLSVWHIDRSRHYKIFKDDVSLTITCTSIGLRR